jgi:polyhydroxybutyrate depolymerase
MRMGRLRRLLLPLTALALAATACLSTSETPATQPPAGQDAGSGDEDAAAEAPSESAADEPGLDAVADEAQPADRQVEADAPADSPASCEPGSRTGKPEGAVDELTDGGTFYNVRMPKTYLPTVGSPLIVVYAPAGADAAMTESFVKLTPSATARGHVIVYTDHITPQSKADFDNAASIPARVSAKWCVDPKRVYLTGHSDGASVASAIALMKLFDAAAIAPSAAGVSTKTLANMSCPPPLGVMVMHSSNDQLFPISNGFGADVAAWWAKCLQCNPTPGAPLPDGCVPHTGCAGGVEVRYCEGSTIHGVWPGLNASILDFFDKHRRP